MNVTGTFERWKDHFQTFWTVELRNYALLRTSNWHIKSETRSWHTHTHPVFINSACTLRNCNSRGFMQLFSTFISPSVLAPALAHRLNAEITRSVTPAAYTTTRVSVVWRNIVYVYIFERLLDLVDPDITGHRKTPSCLASAGSGNPALLQSTQPPQGEGKSRKCVSQSPFLLPAFSPLVGNVFLPFL